MPGLKTKVIIMAALAASAAPMAAAARPHEPELRCRVAGGFGFAVAGRRAISCVYYRPDDRVEFYTGSSGKFGVDLGPVNAQKIVFKVAGADLEHPGELGGKFVGVEGGVTVGFGVSGEGLVGGATGKVVLVPTPPDALYNPDLTGINITAGLGVLELQYAGSERRALHERY